MPTSPRREIVDGKAWLEDIAGGPVRSFCYPQGKFNAALARQVEDAGFACGRTCMLNLTAPPENPYTWGVSTQAFSHSRAIQLRHAAVERNWTGLANYARIFRGAVDWAEHFLRAVAHVERHGGIAHLFLHSWEIDQHDDWDKLRRLLAGVRDSHVPRAGDERRVVRPNRSALSLAHPPGPQPVPPARRRRRRRRIRSRPAPPERSRGRSSTS